MFDTIVSPVALYASEVWTPLVLPKKCFRNVDSLISAWETFKPEVLNQKACRLLLSVHRKASRLAVLGELGRYPIILRAIAHTLKYEWHLSNIVSPSSLVGMAVKEMKEMSSINEDSWYSRVSKIKTLFSISNFSANHSPDIVGKKINLAL